VSPQRQRVNGYLLNPWQGIDSFPRDGRVVEIQDARGDVWLARWHAGVVWIDSETATEPRAWRMI
jgi:hypothetical protein